MEFIRKKYIDRNIVTCTTAECETAVIRVDDEDIHGYASHVNIVRVEQKGFLETKGSPLCIADDERAVTIFDEGHSESEDRFIIIGMSRNLRELTVCYCYRRGNDITRIISARRATANETKLYERGL